MRLLTHFLQQISDKKKIRRNVSTKCKMRVFFGSWFLNLIVQWHLSNNQENWDSDCPLHDSRELIFLGVIMALGLHLLKNESSSVRETFWTIHKWNEIARIYIKIIQHEGGEMEKKRNTVAIMLRISGGLWWVHGKGFIIHFSILCIFGVGGGRGEEGT